MRFAREANAAYGNGQLQEAAVLLEQARVAFTRDLNPHHPTTLATMNDLAVIYSHIGRHAEALNLNEETLALKRSKLGPDHPDTLKSMGNLANGYENLGRYAKALKLREETLELMRSKLGPNHPDSLTSMDNLANSYRALGRDSEALKLHEETLALRRSKLGPDHLETLRSMSNVANIYRKLGREAEVLELHIETVELRRNKFGTNDPETLNSMSDLALSYRELGRFSEALELHEEILAHRHRNQGPEHPDTLRSMGNLANSYSDFGRYAEAMKLQDEALSLLLKKLGPDHVDTLGMQGNLALSYANLGRLNEALQLNERTLIQRRNKLGTEHSETLKGMRNLANSYSAVGRYSEALKLHEETLVLLHSTMGPDHPDLLQSRNDLVITYSELGRHAEALKLGEETLDFMRRKLGPDHPSTLHSMSNLALSYGALGRHAEALALHEKILELRRNGLGVDVPATLQSMGNLANSYDAVGRHIDALRIREEHVFLLRSRLALDHPVTLMGMSNLAVSYRVVGRPAEALKLQGELLELTRSKLGPDHPDSLGLIINQANSYSDLGRPAEALKLRQQALVLISEKLGPDHPHTLGSMGNLADSYTLTARRLESLALRRQSLDVIDRMATSLKVLTRDERSTALSSHLYHYNSLARDLASDPTDHAEALLVTERAKARALLEELTARQAIGTSGITADAAKRLSELRSALEFTDGKLAVAPNDDTRKALRIQRDADRAELDALHHDLTVQYPRYAALSAVQPVTLEQGRALLPEKGVFVSWLLDEQASGVAIALPKTGALQVLRADPGQQMSVRAEAYRWLHALPDADSFAQAVQTIPLAAWQQDGVLYIGAPGKQPADSLAVPAGRYMALRAGAIADHGQWLSDTLLKPLAAQIDPASQWIVSPDGVLATIPWDTIPWNGRPLGLQKQITVIQSLSVYKLLKDREAQYRQERSTVRGVTQPLLVMGGAEYGTGRGERRNFQRAAQIVINGTTTAAADYQRQNAYDYMRSRQWPNLPGSLREAEALHRLMDGRKLTGRDASEIKLREISQSGELARYRNLHFAAHGYLDTAVPSLSALVLTASGSGEGKDGYITAGEWPAFDLKSDLLVMSACETALGKVVSGEGVQGLPYALYVAGNRDTLLSLWQVSDDGTAAFMKRFWAKVKGGQSHALALTETKREFQRGAAGKAYSDSYYWAAFVLYGVQE